MNIQAVPPISMTGFVISHNLYVTLNQNIVSFLRSHRQSLPVQQSRQSKIQRSTGQGHANWTSHGPRRHV